MKKSKLFRILKVLSMALVFFLQIYWYKFRKKPEVEWEKLWENIGSRFRKTLFELEGLLIKIGQLLSIRADLLPNGSVKFKTLLIKFPHLNGKRFRKFLRRSGTVPLSGTFFRLKKSRCFCFDWRSI